MGTDHSRPTQTDRVLAACKLALLAFPQQGEAAALQTLLQLRPKCVAPPLRSLWLQHTIEVLVRGAVLRGEQRRATELLEQQRSVLAATQGPSDVVWPHELELLLQKGEHMEALLRAAECDRTSPSGKGAGLASPRAMLLLAKAKAHALGGSPLNALPHALSALALAEQASLQAVYASAALQLASVQLELDPPRALALLQKVRPQVMRNGSAYQSAQLQQLSAQCRLAMLPPFSQASPPQLQQLRTHILPALSDALAGFARLRCHSEAGQLLYLRARIYNSLGETEADALELRDADAKLFGQADEESKQAAARPAGRLLDFATPGVLEEHTQQLAALDAAAAALYASAG